MQHTAVINRFHAFIIRLCGAMLLLLVLPAQAQEARLDGNVVYLPAVDDYPNLYSLELRVVANRFPIELTLQHVGTAQASLARESPFYDGDLLIVPHIRINGSSYWAELRELSSDRFQLLGYGPNGNSNGGPHDHLGWQRLPGQAKDIGVGADGSVWAVGADDFGDDFGLYWWDGRVWSQNRGSAVRVDVDPRGRPWVINSDDEIFRLERGRWERIGGAASDIGIGADGSVWVVGIDSRRGGHSLYRLQNGLWKKVDGSGVRIDVDRNGNPWVINDDDQIYRYDRGQWIRVPGEAKDIGVGADGSVWIIGANERAGGYGVYRYNGSGWTLVPGSARQISVGPDGEPWVVNRDGDIYRSVGR